MYRKRLGEEGIIKREGPCDDKEGVSPMRRRRALPFDKARRPRASSGIIPGR
jgi:hypothetical protein